MCGVWGIIVFRVFCGVGWGWGVFVVNYGVFGCCWGVVGGVWLVGGVGLGGWNVFWGL